MSPRLPAASRLAVASPRALVVPWRMARPLLLAWSLILPLAACASPVGGGETGDASGTSTTTSTSGTTTGTSGTTSASPTTSGSTTSDSSTTAAPAGCDDSGNLLVSDCFLTIAHRGGGALRPEETLSAFENALAVGADVLEFDVHASADGVLVAIHDATVDRTTEGTGTVKSKTLAELKALDAGYHYSPDDGQTFPYRGTGIEIATVEEILAAFPDEYYLIEIKQSDPPIVEPLLAILEDQGVMERVVIASFDDDTLEAVRAAAPAVFTSMSAAEMLEFNADLGSPDYAAPAGFLQSPWEITSEEAVAFAHAHGLKVHPWTVNNAGVMEDLIARGVDGIMTDDPALLAGLDPG